MLVWLPTSLGSFTSSPTCTSQLYYLLRQRSKLFNLVIYEIKIKQCFFFICNNYKRKSVLSNISHIEQIFYVHRKFMQVIIMLFNLPTRLFFQTMISPLLDFLNLRLVALSIKQRTLIYFNMSFLTRTNNLFKKPRSLLVLEKILQYSKYAVYS